MHDHGKPAKEGAWAMEIRGKIAVVTGAGSGIGHAAAVELARQEVSGIGLVDLKDDVKQVEAQINTMQRSPIAMSLMGDVTDPAFRRSVFDRLQERFGDPCRICVPAAGITRDALAVRLDKTTGKATVYAEEMFRLVTEVNLIAPTYWALEMVARIAEDRHRRSMGKWDPANERVCGTIVFIGSVSSQGNKGQIGYAATKRGLEGVAKTLMKEAMYYGVRCCLIHPGFTDTPMVRALGQEYIEKNLLPFTQLKRLIRPEEIADAISFMIRNSAVSGELWADAGWHPSA
jgi:NAD(P)-dependent dehydrogenase (short-subunit alcohol dehydrogenase family)